MDLLGTGKDKDGKPEFIRDPLHRRFASIDEAIAPDAARRDSQLAVQKILQEMIGAAVKIETKDGDDESVREVEEGVKKLTMDHRLAAKDAEVKAATAALDGKLVAVGNAVHESVLVSDEEANDAIVASGD